MSAASLPLRDALKGLVNQTQPALECALDCGTLMLSTRGTQLSGRRCYAALDKLGSLSKGGFTFSLFKSSLPRRAQHTRWINRTITRYEMPPGGSITQGKKEYVGVVQEEPTENAGVLTIKVVPPSKAVILVPDNIVESTTWPNASAAAMGAEQPHLFGTVERCPLLPVDLPAYTTLPSPLQPGDNQVPLQDATVLASAGTVVIDDESIAYTHRSDTALLGATVTQPHRSGTAAAQSGQAVYLAAGHALNAIDTVRAGDTLINGGTIDLVNATLTYATLPTVEALQSGEHLLMQFDAVDVADTATSSINAIQAATATDSNIVPVTTLPYVISTGAVEASRTGRLYFPAPSQDRIISGTYSVTFTVASSYGGSAEISIGGQTVWAMQAGAVVYDASPATITFDNDANILPITILRDGAGSEVQLAITGASRTIIMGNLDQAAYATVAPGQTLAVKQTTANPVYGKGLDAKLALEWFSADSYTGNAEVWMDGVKLGLLVAENVSGSTLNQTITVDVLAAGNAALQNSDISAVVSGGTASLSNVQSVVHQTIPIAYIPSGTAGGLTRYAAKVKFKPPKGVITGSAGFNHIAAANYSSGTYTSGGGAITDAYHTEVFTANAGGVNTLVIHASADTNTFEFYHEIIDGLFGSYNNAVKVQSVVIEWTIDPILQNNTAASGYSQVNNGALPVSGTSVQANNGAINFQVAAPPRTIITQFALPQATGWDWFTGKVAEVRYPAGAGPNLHVVQVQLPVNFTPLINAPATDINAALTGQYANPADIMSDLAMRLGYAVDMPYWSALRDYFSANGWLFARRQGKAIEAAELLRRCAKMALCQISEGADGLRFIRQLDISGKWTQIDPRELLSPATEGWSRIADVHNHVTLNYRYIDGQPTRVIQATPDNNLLCQYSAEAQIKAVRRIIIAAEWIADEATATACLADYVRLHASLRRIVQLQLPHSYSPLVSGNIIKYTIDRKRILFRIIHLAIQHSQVSLTAEEIL